MAHADLARVAAVSANLTSDAFEVRLESDRPIGEPRVRTEPGFVRVWLPEADPITADLEGDGTAVRLVRLRPGASDTAIAILRIGDLRDVGRSVVEVQRRGNLVTIRIGRGALPVVAPPPVAQAPAPEPTAAASPSAPAPSTSAEARPTDARSAGAQAADARAAGARPSDNAPRSEATDARPEAPTQPLAVTRRSTSQALVAAPRSGSTTLYLVIIAALLGGAYFVVRSLRKRETRNDPHRNIDIVASRRLGARHQILVVRAMGQDYLLSVNAGRTEKLAATASPVLETTDNDKQDGGRKQSLLEVLRTPESEEGKGENLLHRAIEERPRFGAELMRAAQERAHGDRVSLSTTSTTSEAVAGLLRLRTQHGR
ncbi:MAG: flagellar biosynthetic protein FliO [Sandaracinaceae bacterium]|nr:flagellar biosynthetic protein FliO [Sandaracinaceae bacterium]